MPRMFVLYEALLLLVSLLLFPFYLVTGLVRGKYLSNLRSRLGRYHGAPSTHHVWIHAVSVGEVLAARSIWDAIRRERPDLTLVVTTTTATGQEMARRNFTGATIAWFPFDFSFSVRRFLDHYCPSLLVVVETEIWPNVLRHSAARSMPIFLANGRISDRSFRRYRAARLVLRRVLRLFRTILVREERDRERFIAIGASPSAVEVAGNVKFDWEIDLAPLPIEAELIRLIAGREVVVFGSMVEGEDELLLPMWQRLISTGRFLIVAPRKPERFATVAAMLADRGIRFARRSDWPPASPADLLLLDTIGELARIYRFGAVAFVGGSLVEGTGGHNPIEPAAAGIPVAFGVHMSNFREIASTFLDSGAATSIRDPGELEQWVCRLLDDPAHRAVLGARARETVEANRGAAARMARTILGDLA